jgi:rubrerythrin
VLNPKQFVKSETITIQPSDPKEISFPNDDLQDKCEATSQKLIKTFLLTDQGMVLIGITDSLDSSIQLKTEPESPETVAESVIFVKPEPDIKPEIFIGVTESDLSQEMSNLSDDPLRILVHEEKKQHISRVHEGKNPEILPHPPKINRLLFSCFICSKIFQSPADVKIHISMLHEGKYDEYPETYTNSNESKEKFQCYICLKMFKSKYYVKKHFSRDHEVSNPEILPRTPMFSDLISIVQKKEKFQCPICLKEFSSKYTVKDHFSYVHEGNEKSACSICFKVFVSKANFKRHMSQVHEKNKPIQCTSCPKRFGSINDSEKHFRKVHEGKDKDIQDTNDGNNLNGHQDNSEIILPD